MAAWGLSGCVTPVDQSSKPWRRGDAVIVLDAYEDNALDWDKLAQNPKVVGVIDVNVYNGSMDDFRRNW